MLVADYIGKADSNFSFLIRGRNPKALIKPHFLLCDWWDYALITGKISRRKLNLTYILFRHPNLKDKNIIGTDSWEKYHIIKGKKKSMIHDILLKFFHDPHTHK